MPATEECIVPEGIILDTSTVQHSQRVARIALAMGERIDVEQGFLDKLTSAALLHDVGKLHVPQLVHYPGALDEEKRMQLRMHIENVERLLRSFVSDKHIVQMVLFHHEKWNGSGYPEGLTGERIPLGSRIIAVADTYDAMRSSRSYRAALTQQEASEKMETISGEHLDPYLVAVLFSFITESNISGIYND